MSIVYGIKAVGEYEEQRDIEECFKRNMAFKIECGSGLFRIFLSDLERKGDGWNFKGTIAVSSVEGHYSEITKRGTLVFLQTQKVKAGGK